MSDPNRIIRDYQKVKAPDSLKQRVMASYDAAQSPARRKALPFSHSAALMAACFCLVVLSAVFLKFGSTSVLVSGSELSGDGITIVRESESSGFCREARPDEDVIPLEISTFFQTEIRASEGELHIFSSETGELLHIGSEYSFRGKVIIYWNLSQKEAVPQMTVKNLCYDETLELHYSAGSQNWGITAK